MPNFVGLPLSTLLPAFGALAAVVVVFYILKLKRRPVPVPFSQLWQRILRDKEATSLFSQLKRLLSLLLQLALLALMLFALGDPRAAQNLVEGRNIVVLMDGSASMQATDVSPSRAETAKTKLRETVRGLSGSDRMLIAQMDAGLTPLSTLTDDISELEAALDAVNPSDTRADFPRALRFAADTLRGLPNAEIVIASDGILGEAEDALGKVDLEGIKLTFVPVGSGARNAAITGFSVRRYPLDKSRYEVMLEVTNSSKEDLQIELSLFGDGVLTDVTRITLKGGEKLPRFYPNLSGASRELTAKLSLVSGEELIKDDLPADDVAYALLPERRRSRVCVVTEGNMYLEAALLLDEFLDVTMVKPADYPFDGTFDVTIMDSLALPVGPKTGHVLYLNPVGKDLPFSIDKLVDDDDPNIRLGFDELVADHPIIRFTQLADINMAKASILKGEKEDKVIGRSFRGPLLITGRRSGYRFVALGLDIRQSDFPLRISWPLFLLNVINDFVEEDTGYISSFQTGSVWRIPAPSQSEIATVVDPDGVEHVVPVEEGRAVFQGKRAGIYTLRVKESGNKDGVPGEAPSEDGSAPPDGSAAAGASAVPGHGSDNYETKFAANMADPKESDIEPLTELRVSGQNAGELAGFSIGVRREIWMYLLMAVIAISAIEWITFHRRVTV